MKSLLSYSSEISIGYICLVKIISKFLFLLFGWKVKGSLPDGVTKAVMIAAPHTSNWDFLWARCAFFILGINLKYTIKNELFFFPLGWILKSLGGIPIDRSKKTNMVEKMTALFDQYDNLILLITPEGTRSYSAEWKKGFYYIAEGAKVPLVLGYLDYDKKHAGIGPLFETSGDVEKDMKAIQNFYRNITPKYPEKGVK